MSKRSTFAVWGMSGSLTTLDALAHDEALATLQNTLDAMTVVASRFRDDSEISLLNQSYEPAVLSPLMTQVFEAARDAYVMTRGACDPTTLPAIEAMGYRSDYDHLVPQGHETATAPAPGLANVSFDPTTSTLVRPAGVRFDFGATAKALTCDLVARAVGASSGVCVEIGGDVAFGGPAPLTGWVIGVSDATTIAGDEPRIALTGGGVATSSSAVRTWETTTTTRHHIIDPRTGQSATSDIICASVAADSCVTANAFATACVAWGSDVLYDLTQAGWSARLVTRNGDVLYAGGWPEDHA